MVPMSLTGPALTEAPGPGPLVSIVSVFHNRAAHVRDSIQSLLSQTYEPIEIIVVDDGSTDGTNERLAELHDPRLRLVTQQNAGFTVSLNRAIRLSSGKYVAIHGSGDVSYPERITRQVRLLESRTDVGVVGCRVDNSASRYRVAQDGPRITNQDFFHQLTGTGCPFTHGEAMFRRTLFDRIGGYRETFTYAQDFDFWLRLSRHAEYAIVPELLYKRLHFANGVNVNPERSLMQACFSNLALQCALANDRPDLVDRYGAGAAFLRRPSPRLARKLASMALQWKLENNDAAARLLSEAVLRENPGWTERLTAAACRGGPLGDLAWFVVFGPFARLRSSYAEHVRPAVFSGDIAARLRRQARGTRRPPAFARSPGPSRNAG